MESSIPEQLTAVEEKEDQCCDTHQDSTVSSQCQPVHPKQCHCEQCISQYGGVPQLSEVTENKNISDASCSGPSHITSDESKSSSLEVNVESAQETNAGETPIRVTRKAISCEFCGKVFSHTGDLNKHRRRHTGERPYPCPQCNKRFSHASNLLRHQKIHSGETPHQCPTCARRFSRKDKMLDHIKTSHCKPNPGTHT
jgi:uncharacterized Zn-finger protein